MNRRLRSLVQPAGRVLTFSPRRVRHVLHWPDEPFSGAIAGQTERELAATSRSMGDPVFTDGAGQGCEEVIQMAFTSGELQARSAGDLSGIAGHALPLRRC
jgi:hypothetical protein